MLLSSPGEELGPALCGGDGLGGCKLILWKGESRRQWLSFAKVRSPLCWGWYRALKIRGKGIQNTGMTK